MAPRLAHKKTRSGCRRCKQRKVKCDEVKPHCSACTRHGVSCEYSDTPITQGDHRSPSLDEAPGYVAEHEVELRLMHEWTAYTSETLSTTVDFWKLRAPLLALENRFVFEALLALSALHASRQEAKAWSGLHGREIALTPKSQHSNDAPVQKGWKAYSRDNNLPGPSSIVVATPEARSRMLEISRKYFSRAVEGQQKAVGSMNVETIRSTHLCSMLLSYYSLFTLSEKDDGVNGLENMVGLMNWMRLSRGIRFITDQMPQISMGMLQVESMHGQPDLSDVDELFHPSHMEPFKYLLSNVNGDEVSEDDRIAYEHSLSYVGLIYQGISQKLDSPLATGRRCNAMPASVPIRFLDLMEASKPRAIALMAHLFACMQLVSEQYPWFRGLAERQVPIICGSLPQQWTEFVQWPMHVVQCIGGDGSRPILSPSSGMYL